MSYGLLLLRVVVGGTMFGHGAQKLFGWFGGYGPKGTGGFFEQRNGVEQFEFVCDFRDPNKPLWVTFCKFRWQPSS